MKTWNLKVLSVWEGMDGLTFFSCGSSYDELSWEKQDGIICAHDKIAYKVQIKHSRYDESNARALFDFWIRGRQNGSISTYRLDFVYSEKQRNGKRRRRYVEEDNSQALPTQHRLTGLDTGKSE